MQSSHGSKAMLILRACSGLQTSGFATAMDSGLMIRDTYIERERERETYREREREKHYISSTNLGLIRCMTTLGVRAIICIQTICDKLGNPMQVNLPHKLHHRACMLPNQPGITTTNVLQGPNT